MNRAEELHRRGVAASGGGRPGPAVRLLRTALRHADGDADRRGHILVSLAWAEAERGNVALGFELLDEAERLIPPSRRGVLHAQRGLLLRRTGHDGPARRQYDAAVAALDAAGAHLDLAKVLSNRGLLHLGAARAGAARADLRRSVELSTRHGYPVVAATARHNLGDLELLAGDIPAALATYGTVDEAYREVAPGKLAELSVDRARALLAAGLYREADRELATAVAQAGRQHLSHVHADALLARAEAALLAGDTRSAARWARAARARFVRRDNHRRAALASLVLLRATGDGDALAQADELDGFGLREDARVARLLAVRAGRCRVVPRPRPGDRLDTRLLWRLTSAEAATGGAAFRHLAAGLDELHRYRAQLGCLDLQTGAAVHGHDLARAGLTAALATGSPARVFRWAERARAQALLVPPVRPPDDPAAVADLEELRQVRHNLRRAELAGRPAGALRARSTALRRRIRERAWAAAGPRTASGPAELRSVRAALGEAALVTYIRDDPLLLALVLVGGAARLVPLGRYAAAEQATLRLRADLDAQAGRALPARLAAAVTGAIHVDAAATAAAVLDPILPLVGDRDLVVVPTGRLVTVPWAVLPGCRGRAVTVTPSASRWLAARARRAVLERPLLVAGPGNDRGEAEVRTIAAGWPGARVLVGPAATTAATLAGLDGAPLAHLAAHGHHEPDNPLFSALELGDGPLMGYDLPRMASVPAVVVLSACDLGLADVRPGDETLGMVTAWLAAGAGTVIASVSRVGDEVAMTVMTAWHRALRSGNPPATALASTPPAGFVCFGAG